MQNLRNLAIGMLDVPMAKRIIPWFENDGEYTLRYEYDLNKTSVVFDLGGYRGDWAAKMNKNFGCPCHIFEPEKKNFNLIKLRFKDNPNIICNNAALGSSNESFELHLSEDENGHSMSSQGCSVQDCNSVEFWEYAKNNQISKIDVLKMNIEGAEYDLLDHIQRKDGWQGFIENAQIQFHDFVYGKDEVLQRYLKIFDEFSKYYEPTFYYPFVFESWRRK